jgi:hypothetical protein
MNNLYSMVRTVIGAIKLCIKIPNRTTGGEALPAG